MQPGYMTEDRIEWYSGARWAKDPGMTGYRTLAALAPAISLGQRLDRYITGTHGDIYFGTTFIQIHAVLART